MKLLLADNLKLPETFVTETCCIFGKRGSGKSSTGARMAEQLAAAGIPFAVLDPPDAWWGLKSSKDGKSPGVAVYVFGGRHADLPMEPGAGALMADILVDHRINVIMSLRHFTVGERSRFCIDFANQLFKRNTEPLMLFCEEAHRLFPQTREEYGHGSRVEEMLGAMNKLHTEGRTSGLGLTLITQRPALLHATPRNQAEILFCHRIVGPHDRKAIEEWVKYHHQDDEKRDAFLSSLATLKTGECWVWGPEWPEGHPIGLRQVKILEPETFDSRRTPKPGELLRQPKALAPVDIEKLRDKMAATIERAKADDPKELKKQIAALRAELQRKQLAPTPQIDPAAIERAAANAASKRDAEWESKLRSVRSLLMKSWERFVDEIMAALHPGEFKAPERPRLALPSLPPVPRPVPASRDRTTRSDGNPRLAGVSDLPSGEARVLTALAQYPAGLFREQLTVLTAFKRSTRDAYIQRLGERGFTTVQQGKVFATESGVAVLGEGFEPLPTGIALQEYWLDRLPIGESKILQVLIEAYPKAVDRETLSEAIGQKRSTRDAYIQRMGAKELVESVGRGEVRASENLF